MLHWRHLQSGLSARARLLWNNCQSGECWRVHGGNQVGSPGWISRYTICDLDSLEFKFTHRRGMGCVAFRPRAHSVWELILRNKNHNQLVSVWSDFKKDLLSSGSEQCFLDMEWNCHLCSCTESPGAAGPWVGKTWGDRYGTQVRLLQVHKSHKRGERLGILQKDGWNRKITRKSMLLWLIAEIGWEVNELVGSRWLSWLGKVDG
jgi:hypothetical protein